MFLKFVYLGKALRSFGHRVRLATHAEYRGDVTSAGLEFYPLAGDPKKLSSYMVKTEGRLLPDLLNEEERKELPEKMQMLRDITFSTWPACTAADPEAPEHGGFVADAIISNPVTYGHIHCAEALCAPLHIMFPQPWYPTKCFPHPLSNMDLKSSWSSKNWYSYGIVDQFMWLGLGFMINQFRQDVLKLPPLRTGDNADSILNDNRVPISHMWSPSFVPKCPDWPQHVDVVGEFRDLSVSVAPYLPSPEFAEFLARGPKPVYIGFGSMVIADGQRLADLIVSAANQVQCRIILQNGWTKYAPENSSLSDYVFVVGNMPHDWLFRQVCAVIHHGGAGTTSAGLRCGNSTFICPFFGDQHFWGEMVRRAGAGPAACPIAKLTAERLVDALRVLLDAKTKGAAESLAVQMNVEDGVKAGVESFHRHLPVADMLCEVSIFQRRSALASFYCPDCGLKMSLEVDAVIHQQGSGRENHCRVPFR
jgi:sterol 3beta-glucosyltransferase